MGTLKKSMLKLMGSILAVVVVISIVSALIGSIIFVVNVMLSKPYTTLQICSLGYITLFAIFLLWYSCIKGDSKKEKG